MAVRYFAEWQRRGVLLPLKSYAIPSSQRSIGAIYEEVLAGPHLLVSALGTLHCTRPLRKCHPTDENDNDSTVNKYLIPITSDKTKIKYKDNPAALAGILYEISLFKAYKNPRGGGREARRALRDRRRARVPRACARRSGPRALTVKTTSRSPSLVTAVSSPVLFVCV